MASGFELNCRGGMHAQILRAVDKWENAVSLNANPFHLKGRAPSCSGHLNGTVL
jgi:hypothetical protein